MIRKEAENLVKDNFPTIVNEELSQKYIDYLVNHINDVNYYAGKVGLSFPNHDLSKLTMFFPAYRYTVKPKDKRTKEEQEQLDYVTLMHVMNACHHPEYWCDHNMLKGFTRSNFTPNGILDCTEMPEECLNEMVIDWCATGKRKGNSATEWFNKVNNVRWKFNNEQQMYIRLMIDKMEN